MGNEKKQHYLKILS